MSYRSLLAGAALALIVSPALAEPPTAPVSPSGVTKPAETSAAATGTAVNTSSVVEMADLKTGALVRDPYGLEVGTISKVTPGMNGEAATVTLSLAGKTADTSAATLTNRSDGLYSTRSKAEIWAAAKSPH